jgi:hypothetical protein
MPIALHIDDKDEHDYAAEFKTKRTLTKRQLLKIPAMSFLRVKWKDAPDQVVLLLEKAVYTQGSMSLHTMYQTAWGGRHYVNNEWVTHDQVLADLGACAFPVLTD